jgi:hypothetical protein
MGRLGWGLMTIGLLLLAGIPVGSADADWQGNLAWCAGDTGAPDCPEQYVAVGAQSCLGLGVGGGTGMGNRQCLIYQARYLASQGYCAPAFATALVCQCQNSDARQEILSAGMNAVCNWLTSW